MDEVSAATESRQKKMVPKIQPAGICAKTLGKVTKVSETDDITLEIAEGIRVQVMKGTLADVRSKTDSVKVKGGAQQGVHAVQPSSGLLGSLFGFFGRK